MEMTEEKKKAIALFRYGIISPIVTRQITVTNMGDIFVIYLNVSLNTSTEK